MFYGWRIFGEFYTAFSKEFGGRSVNINLTKYSVVKII